MESHVPHVQGGGAGEGGADLTESCTHAGDYAGDDGEERITCHIGGSS